MDKALDYLLDTKDCPIKILDHEVAEITGMKMTLQEASQMMEKYLEKYNTPDAVYTVGAFVKSDRESYTRYIEIDVVEIARRQADQQLQRKKQRLVGKS